MALDEHPMWRKPQHHLDVEHDNDHVHWMELFYDLIHVVTIFLLGNYLSDHHGLGGFFTFLWMFVAFWFAWAELSVYNSIYVSTDLWHRILMALQITTVMFMAAAIPSIGGGGWPFFALAYAANRFIIGGLYQRARRVGAEKTSLTGEMTRNMSIFAILFAISAFLPKPYNYWLFCLALASNQIIYMIPKISVMRFERFNARWGHMAERFALLTLIVIGEGFFKLVVTLSEKGIYKVSPDYLVNFFIGGLSTFVMCWIYFDLIGNSLTKTEDRKSLIIWWLGHLLLMICATMVGVALAGEVKVGFFEPFPTEYAAFGCAGLAGYILALGILQNVAEERVAHRFATWRIKIFGIALAIATFFIVPFVPAIIGNLLWGTALFSQIFAPITRAYRVFSKE